MDAVLILLALFMIISIGVICLIAGLLGIGLVKLWVQASSARVPLAFSSLIGMRLRRVNPRFIVMNLIRLRRAGVAVDSAALETHFLAGGNLNAVADAAISAMKADLTDSGFARLAALDLAGADVRTAVNSCVKPRVVTCPRDQGMITCVAKDGIKLGVRIRVTIRSDLDKLIGGANEETVVARVGEGVVNTIGSSTNHKTILENPSMIAKGILGRGLDNNTAFNIISVDVEKVEVLENVGARLAQMQAEANKLIAQAKAEARHAAAKAVEQEMKAKVVDMKSRLTLAEAEIPEGMSMALARGKMFVFPHPVQSVCEHIHWIS